MPNLSPFNARGHISRYNHLKVCPKSGNPKNIDPKSGLFCPFFPFLGRKTSYYDKISPGNPFSTWKWGISGAQYYKIAHKLHNITVSPHPTLTLSLVLSYSKQNSETADFGHCDSVLAHIRWVPEREMYKNICRTLAPLMLEAISWGITT